MAEGFDAGAFVRQTLDTAETYRPEVASSQTTETSAAAPPPRLIGLGWREACAVQPTDTLVRGLLGEGALSVLYGPAACGKTFLALWLAFCIAMGWLFFGRKTKRGLVLYIAAEGQRGLGKRLAALEQRFQPAAEPPLRLLPTRIDLATAGTADLHDLIRAVTWLERLYGLPLVMIVVDTLNRAFGGNDENSSADMGRFLRRPPRFARPRERTSVLSIIPARTPAGGRAARMSFAAASTPKSKWSRPRMAPGLPGSPSKKMGRMESSVSTWSR